MSQQYPGTWKQCATCAFWIGPRDCDYFGQYAIVSSGTVEGRCGILSGGWKGQKRQACAQCSDWQKWPVLR